MATVLTPERIKELIQEWIVPNGKEEIRADMFNTILSAMMSYVGVGYACKGVAPQYAPSSEVPVLYIGGPGTYKAYYNEDVVVPQGSIIIWTNDLEGAWSHTILDVATSIVAAEVQRATEKEGQLQQQITSNAEGLAAEVERATGKEGQMQEQINANAEGLAAEVERATGKEGQMQEQINANAEGLAAEVERATGKEGQMQEQIDTNTEGLAAEILRAQAAESRLQDIYEGLTQNPVVIGPLPSSGQADTIYRVPGTSSYADYMWDGTQFVLMATYTAGHVALINVNVLNHDQGTPHAAYASAAAARADITAASGLRALGLQITYLLTDGVWYTDQYIGADISGWNTPSNWKTLGPVIVSKNTETGHFDIHIGNNSCSVASAEEFSQLDQEVNGIAESVIVVAENDRTYNVIPAGATRIFTLNNVALAAGQKLVIEFDSEISDLFDNYNYYVQGVMTAYQIVSGTQRKIIVDILEDVVSTEIYCSVANPQWKEGASSLLPVTFGYKVSLVTPAVHGLTERVSTLEERVSTLEEDVSTLEEDVSTLEENVSTLEEDVSTLEENVSTLDQEVNGTAESVIVVAENDRTYNVIPAGATRIFTLNNVALAAGQKLVIEFDSEISDLFDNYNYYVQGVMTAYQTVSGTQRKIIVDILEDVVSTEIYCSVANPQWKEGASSLLPVTFGYKVSLVTPAVHGLTKRVSTLEEDVSTNYKKLKTAVDARRTGIFSVGQNAVIGLDTLTYNANDLRPMQEKYKVVAPNPIFPMVKKSTLQRLYDGDSNMLYLCSSSADKLFYSICPTDTKHIDYSSVTQYAVNYFYFASKSAPTTLTKVVLPDYLPGGESNVIGRKKYVFEMSNGDVLLEVENGVQYAGKLRYHNIYKITGLFDITPVDGVITVPSENISLSLSLNFGNRVRISAFMQIAEANPGEIVLAPYGQGITAIIYHSTDYGDTWEVIFCGNVNNESLNIPPKAEHQGTETAYGEWPTAQSVISSTPLDWAGTGNGNIHIHGIAYDKWMDRLWVCTGDGAGYPNGVTGIWWTDDWGRTWNRIATRNTTVMDGIETQLMFPVPIEHSVLFGTDGNGDGCWRWSRTTKQDDVVLEPAYNFLGGWSQLVMVAGRWARFRDFVLISFAPDNVEQGDWKNRGGIVATHNGFDFYKIYKDEFTDTTGTDQHAFDTAEIGWSCEIVDCGDNIVLKADKGGIIILYI